MPSVGLKYQGELVPEVKVELPLLLALVLLFMLRTAVAAVDAMGRSVARGL